MSKPKKPAKTKKWKIKLDMPNLIAGAILGLLVVLAYNAFTAKYDINIILPSHVEDNNLKIILDNIGDKPLTNQTLTVKSCYTDTYDTFYPSILYSNRQITIEYNDIETIDGFKKWNCSDLSNTNFEDSGFPVKTYMNKTNNKLVVPSQNTSITTCGYCFWNITYKSDNLNKSYIDKTYSSMQLTMGIIGDNVSENSTDLIYYSTITWMIFDSRMLRAK